MDKTGENISKQYQDGMICLKEAANQAVSVAAHLAPEELVPFLSPEIQERLRATIEDSPCFDEDSLPPPPREAVPDEVEEHWDEYCRVVKAISEAGCYRLTKYYGLTNGDG